MENDIPENLRMPEEQIQQPQQKVPNSTAVLVLGILSIVTCCCYGVVGIILSIIALVLAKNGTDTYNAEPDKYTESSYNNLKAGRIVALIGLILSALTLIWIIVVHYFLDQSFVKELQQKYIQQLQQMQKGK